MELKAKQFEHKTKVVDIPFDFNRYDKLVINNVDMIYVIDLSNILFIKADGRDTVFHLIDMTIVSFQTIECYHNILDKRFFRVHESYIVNMLHIKEIDDDYSNLSLKNNKIVPVAESNKALFKKLLEGAESDI